MIIRAVLLIFLSLIILLSVLAANRTRHVADINTLPLTLMSKPLNLSEPLLISPDPGGIVVGPLVIRGYVPKSWTFEGQFMMQLLDVDRQIIFEAAVPVEWDSENTKQVLYFVESYNFHTSADSGFLVLKNDNPSGLSRNQKSIEVPLIFSKPPANTVYLFLYDLEEDKKICNCTACQVVLPTPVSIPVTKTPIRDTFNLLTGKMHKDFYVKSLNLKDGVLDIEFPHVDGFTSGGACAQTINNLQITKTAMQFSEVKRIRTLPDSMFQP